MIFVLDNYDSFTHNLVQYLCELGAEVEVARNDAVGVDDIARRCPEAILISPGPGKPDGAGVTLEVLRRFEGQVPIFGVCLGLQAIGQHFGGRVVPAARVVHGKTSLIHHHAQGVFRNIPSPFAATRYHSLVVDRHSLPSCLDVTAWTVEGEVMGLRHQSLAIEGVQFHPESILTLQGLDLLRNFLEDL